MRAVGDRAVRAVMERRVLVNYRIEPGVLQAVLPAPFRPSLVDGYGVGSICLIRLAEIRPAGWLPVAPGLRLENAAHRIAVLADTADGPVPGVYIPGRYTSSRLVTLTRKLLFPRLRMARFHVQEKDGGYRIMAQSPDGKMRIAVTARIAARLPADSVFASLHQASEFFQLAQAGYSDTPVPGVFDGVALETSYRDKHPLLVNAVASSYFDDPCLFPPGTSTVDSAFAVTGLATWRPIAPLVMPLGNAVPAGQR
ncbi:MAG: DUF2071 domain-containing protein [Streptosporangiaceae bacterium]